MSPNDIQKLIDKYGMPAWEAAQRQVWVNFWTEVFLSILLLVTCIGLVLLALHGLREARKTSWSSWEPISIIAAIFAFCCLVPAVIFAIVAAQTWANPEWAAIQTLISLVPVPGS